MMYAPLGFVSIPFPGWECIGLFRGDVVKAHGSTPAQAFNAYKKQCKDLSPIRTKLSDWIKS